MQSQEHSREKKIKEKKLKEMKWLKIKGILWKKNIIEKMLRNSLWKTEKKYGRTEKYVKKYE